MGEVSVDRQRVITELEGLAERMRVFQADVERRHFDIVFEELLHPELQALNAKYVELVLEHGALEGYVAVIRQELVGLGVQELDEAVREALAAYGNLCMVYGPVAAGLVKAWLGGSPRPDAA